ncbi:hypothetical protein SAMN05421664_1621 [Chryseobacterium soldanellicola]|uniref:Uncharacterized protein n=1 Tax=Chryseobacterium soldanellicola TaxID=311333 RepID=A0A1H1AXS4_9FLAO|nr:hypothetical protein [Chryseobacterium soldanellicola]SDQ44341.1 hypothetical protein SAMN05421664_1621 [Chryseobacterium soldanellicola]
MKKILQITLIFVSIISFAQAQEIIKERGNLSNPKGNIYKSLEVIDQREEQKIGEMPFGDNKEMKEIVFPTSINTFLSQWYTDSNHKGGKHEMVLVLKKLKAYLGETEGKETEGDIEFSAQTFLKEGDTYKFLYKKDTVYSFRSKNISDVMMKNIPVVFAMFLKKTYTLKPKENPVAIDALTDYESYVKANSEAYRNEKLKDGIYLNHTSFMNQTPEPGNYVLEKNEKGAVLKAIKEENGKKDKISANEMFIYVENGKAYKKTFSGFLELNKNDRGFYLISNRGYILPVQNSAVFLSVGAGQGGMYGGIAVGLVGILERGFRQNKARRSDTFAIYIDPQTGEYDFSEE